MKRIDEDYEAWEAYPQHRWVFNKLELSQKLGYECGPACLPVNHSGLYIVRPIYNLYGMSVSARLIYLSREDKNDIENHMHIPPGHFWCKSIEGEHHSIDYRYVYGGKNGIHSHWEPFNTLVAEKDDLKFTKWIKVENEYFDLPNWVDEFQDCGFINIEFINGKIIEIHLRTGNDLVEDNPEGTVLIPVWKDTPRKTIEEYIAMGYKQYENRDGEIWDASGNIDNPRLGVLIWIPSPTT